MNAHRVTLVDKEWVFVRWPRLNDSQGSVSMTTKVNTSGVHSTLAGIFGKHVFTTEGNDHRHFVQKLCLTSQPFWKCPDRVARSFRFTITTISVVHTLSINLRITIFGKTLIIIHKSR